MLKFLIFFPLFFFHNHVQIKPSKIIKMLMVQDPYGTIHIVIILRSSKPVSYEEMLIPSWKIPKQDVREQWKVAFPGSVCTVKGIPNQILL